MGEVTALTDAELETVNGGSLFGIVAGYFAARYVYSTAKNTIRKHGPYVSTYRPW